MTMRIFAMEMFGPEFLVVYYHPDHKHCDHKHCDSRDDFYLLRDLWWTNAQKVMWIYEWKPFAVSHDLAILVAIVLVEIEI